MKILGVFFNDSIEASLITQNWEPKIEEMKKAILGWSRHNSTLLGKCIIVKTFLISKIAYILQSLSLPDEILTEIDTLLFRFLWKKKNFNSRAHEKIKRSVLCLNGSEGGINMISIKDQQKVMLIRWLQRAYMGTSFTQQKVISYFLKNIGGIEYIINSNTNSKDFQGLHLVKSLFWRNAINTWIDLKKSGEKAGNYIPLFNNNDIQYKNKTLFIKKWINMNCKYVHDFTQNGIPKPLNQIRNIVGNYGGLITDYLAVLNAINNSSLYQLPKSMCANIPPEFKMDNKTLRSKIVKQKDITINSVQFWKRKYNLDLNNYFSLAINCTKEARLRCLHLKLIHNIYPTNILLKKMFIKDSDRCDSCNQIDFIEHAFYQCEPIKKFWNDISKLISTSLNIQFSISPPQALLGLPGGNSHISSKERNEINHIILIAKLSIVKSKATKNANIKVIFEQEIELRKSTFHIIKC